MTSLFKMEKLVFSGKEEDFTFFQEQFEAHMYVLKRTDILLDRVRTPEVATTETNEVRTAREAALKRHETSNDTCCGANWYSALTRSL